MNLRLTCIGICVLASFFRSVSVSEGKLTFVLSPTPGTWPQAHVACQDVRGSLAILDNLELQQKFNSDVQSAVGEQIWVGRYVAYTPIVTIDGCYRNQTLGVRKTTALVNNYLVTCIRECPNSAYIGMQDQLCYCLDSLVPQAVPMPGTNCQTPCPGEQDVTQTTYLSQCGNVDRRVDTVSVYRRVRDEQVQLDSSAPNQGECIAYNSMSKQWLPADCNLPKPFTCDAKRCPGPAPMCVLESANPDTWFTARAKCEGSGAHLATVNMTTNSYFQQTVILGDPVYWTGLHRKELIAWDYDDNSKYIQESDRCFTVSRNQAGSWVWHLGWCLGQHRYVCVQDDRNTPSPITTTRTTPTVTPATARPTARPATNHTTQNLPTVNPFARPISVTSGSRSMSRSYHIKIIPVLFSSLTIFVSFAITVI